METCQNGGDSRQGHRRRGRFLHPAVQRRRYARVGPYQLQPFLRQVRAERAEAGVRESRHDPDGLPRDAVRGRFREDARRGGRLRDQGRGVEILRRQEAACRVPRRAGRCGSKEISRIPA